MEDLYSAFHAADNIVLKKYVTSLSEAPCIEMSDTLKQIEIGSDVTLYRVGRIVYDKNENIQDKLTTVYSTIFSLKNCGLVMMVHGSREETELYLGIVVRDFYTRQDADNKTTLAVVSKKRDDYGRVLENTFEGNFPGSDLKLVMNRGGKTEKGTVVRGKAEIIEDFLGKAECVAAVSSIPAVRNGKEYKNHEFVQGLEKLIDTMRGKEYTALILADVMDNEKIEEMCAEYEDLYAQLSPFKSSSQTLSAQRSESDTKSIVEGVTNTTNHTLSKAQSHGTSTSKTHTDTLGGSINAGVHIGFKKLGVSAGSSVQYSHAYGRTTGKTESTSETESNGTAESLTKQNSVAKALSESNGESLQINHENRAVKTLMDRIDEQIKRMRGCEDFGMFDTCAYFAAKEYSVAVTAASAFKSLTRGENSSVESSAVNIWRDKVEVDYIKEYLMRFYHPEFLTVLDEKHQYPTTATMLISGKEMAYQMALPKKSVAGIPVVGCAEFGREIVQLNESSGSEIELGSIYHMYTEEQTPVRLNVRNLTAHTFITGSTGAGKSTTVYKMLDELTRGSTEENVRFMVVEPAKGEYKNALAVNARLDVHVYGTNPKQTKLLRINPFRFPHAIHIYEHMDRLTEIFNVCWPMYAAMPAVLKAAIENAYRKAGWDLMTSENPYGEVYPCFADVANEVNAYINSSEYSNDTKGDYKGSLVTRLTSLTNGINGLIFAADDLSDEELFEQNTIVDLSRAGNPDTKALIMGLLILKLQEYRMAQAKGSDAVLRHVTVLEEAHNLLKRTSTEQSSESANLVGKSVEMLANAIAEMRTYGEGFIIADQAPGLLDASVIRNTNTKIIMRLPDEEDRKLVGKAANLNDDQIAEIAKLPCGVTAVYQSEWTGPVLCKVEKPNLKQEPFGDPEPFQKQQEKGVLFELLDRNFREKLDETEFRDGFRHAVLRSGVPTSVKIDLIEYLNAEGDEQKFRSLATAVYDAFQNAEKAVLYAADKPTMSEVRDAILEALEIPAEEYDVQQINDLVYLLLWEYRELHLKTNPVWNDFLDNGRIV